ncbi:MAG TPA: tRNA 4-thiouridine(8) synthase ThiI [Spirochaetota bacterium]|nr:tRNA 4-thiouridine(8) synthase ThiI [Spirochaetota bacterium]HPS85789.1 tRNA 4-thiouridine(8) synthase ThiI [Spirochaetota bacterium]
MKSAKCILLYSGGLDSLLTGKILLDQGIEVIGLHCILPYFPPDLDPDQLKESIIAKQIGLNLVHYRCGEEYINMLKNPQHGYGKHINPCIDCKIFFIKKAAEMMLETGADFVATGEVVGQRPMSQHKHTLIHIENNTLKGRLLRPLSAKLLAPTIPETEGIIDREKFYDISGRGRTRQIELAKSLGIKDFSSPAGGCLFTDKFIAERIKDLIKNTPDFEQSELYLLKIGRHFRINPSLKIIISRNEQDTLELEKYEKNSDYFFKPDFSGPSAYAKGILNEDDINTVNSIICRYGKPSPEGNLINIYSHGNLYKEISTVEAISDSELEKFRI